MGTPVSPELPAPRLGTAGAQGEVSEEAAAPGETGLRARERPAFGSASGLHAGGL